MRQGQGLHATEETLARQAKDENHVWMLCLPWSYLSGLTGNGCLCEEMKNIVMGPRAPNQGQCRAYRLPETSIFTSGHGCRALWQLSSCFLFLVTTHPSPFWVKFIDNPSNGFYTLSYLQGWPRAGIRESGIGDIHPHQLALGLTGGKG